MNAAQPSTTNEARPTEGAEVSTFAICNELSPRRGCRMANRDPDYTAADCGHVTNEATMTKTHHTRRAMRLAAVVLVSSAAVSLAQPSAEDYTQWRGQNRDGSASAFSPPKTWPDKLPLKWKVDIGAGYATPLVVGSRVYTIARQGGDEVMMAL